MLWEPLASEDSWKQAEKPGLQALRRVLHRGKELELPGKAGDGQEKVLHRGKEPVLSEVPGDGQEKVLRRDREPELPETGGQRAGKQDSGEPEDSGVPVGSAEVF